MTAKQPIWTARWLKAIDEVDRRQWDRLAQPLETSLLEWQWLHDLEASGSIAAVASANRTKALTL